MKHEMNKRRLLRMSASLTNPKALRALTLLCGLSLIPGCHLFSGADERSEEEELSPAPPSTLTPSSARASADNEPNNEPKAQGQRIIARVNGEGVLEEEFLAEYEERVRTYRIRKREVPPRLEYTYKLSVMNQLINNTLVRQELKRSKVSLTEDELNQALMNYKARFRSEKNFQSYLSQSNKSQAEVIEKVKFDATLEKLLAQEDPFLVKEEELISAYEAQKEARYTTPPKVRARHILVTLPLNAPKRAAVKAKREALKIVKRAREAGVDFAALAKERSQDPKTKARGGDLGLLEQKGSVTYSEAFEQAAALTPLQTPSAPVLSSQGWHILKVTDRQPEQLRVSQIFIKGPQAQKTAEELAQRALIEPFAELARTTSQDEASRVRGGDLDFLHPKSPHRFGEQFKEGVFKLKRGELSVVQSAQGSHVVLITDARPTRVRVSHILLAFPAGATEAQRETLRLEAKSLYDQLMMELSQSGARSNAFTRLARKRSDDNSSRLRGGDIGPFYIGGEPHFSKEVERALFSQAPGKISDPIRSPLGWHILKVEQREPRQTKSLNEVRDELSAQLKSKQLRRSKALFMQRLKSSAQIERHLDLKGP